MNDKLKQAIKILKDYRKGDFVGDTNLCEAIDTVVKALEKPFPTDEQKKERGNLTCRVMLRQLNCLYERNNVTMSVKQLEHWFETGQHLKEWKEWDTI